MAEIAEEMRSKFAVGDIAMMHRIGRLEIGESSILIAVAAPHRQPAFEACAYAWIASRKKRRCGKKEFFADGEAHWVQPPEAVQSLLSRGTPFSAKICRRP